MGTVSREDRRTTTHDVLRDGGWTAVEVEEPQCYFVTAVDGRARLYELRVAVAW